MEIIIEQRNQLEKQVMEKEGQIAKLVEAKHIIDKEVIIKYFILRND